MNAGSRGISTLQAAVDAWLEAKRALEQAMPWTAEWLRMIEGDRRAAYLALMSSAASDGPPGGIRTPDLLIRSQSL